MNRVLFVVRKNLRHFEWIMKNAVVFCFKKIVRKCSAVSRDETFQPSFVGVNGSEHSLLVVIFGLGKEHFNAIGDK